MKHRVLVGVVATALGLPAAASAQQLPSASIEQGGATHALAFGGGCIRFPDGAGGVCSVPPADYPAPALNINPAAAFTLHVASEVNAVRVLARESTGSAQVPVALTDPHTATITPTTALYGRLEVSVTPVLGGDENYAGTLPAAPTPAQQPPVPPINPAQPRAPVIPPKATLKVASGFRLNALRFTAVSNKPGTAKVMLKVGGVGVTRSLTFTKAGPVTFRVNTTAAQNKRLRRLFKKGPLWAKATINVNGASATASATLRK